MNPKQFKVLDAQESYTFSKYFDLPFSIQDIVGDFGYKFQRAPLNLPTESGIQSRLEHLTAYLNRNLKWVRPVAEITRREIFIFPILAELCDYLEVMLNDEYNLSVNQWLKGNLDYYIETSDTKHILVIEAKQSDLTRGFTQLAAELAALDLRSTTQGEMLYGAVTTGDLWRFGQLDRMAKVITEDTTFYRVPNDLSQILGILAGVLQEDA
jgi:hypothetical protein